MEDTEQVFDYLANASGQVLIGLLVGGVLLFIPKIYTPQRALMHYCMAGVACVLYIVAVTLFQDKIDLRRAFVALALLFVVYYGNKARLYLHAMELRLSKLQSTEFDGPMVCTVNVNIGGVVYQCQRYQYHRGKHEVITDNGSIKWTGVL